MAAGVVAAVVAAVLTVVEFALVEFVVAVVRLDAVVDVAVVGSDSDSDCT